MAQVIVGDPRDPSQRSPRRASSSGWARLPYRCAVQRPRSRLGAGRAAGHGGTASKRRTLIVLDTNVLSALRQSQPDQRVVDWLDQQPAKSVSITAVNPFEIRYGLAQLPPEQRRTALEQAFSALPRDDLQGRVLPFDQSAADHAARLAGARPRAGRGICRLLSSPASAKPATHPWQPATRAISWIPARRSPIPGKEIPDLSLSLAR